MQKPFAAFRGEEPYVFVCYAHENSEVVYPEIARLHAQNANIWYDEGISPGKVWRGEIAEAIQGAAKLIFFVSSASIASDHCRREVEYALDRSIEVVPVYLEEITLPPDLDMVLGRIQAIHRSANPAYTDQLATAFEVEARADKRAQRGGARRPGLLAVAIAVVALSVGGLVYLAGSPRQEAPAASETVDDVATIAVLPLRNISGSSDLNYMADAVSEEIAQQLSLLDSLRVISMNSSRNYQDSALDTRAIAAALTATHVVEGFFNKTQDSIRVSLRLIDGRIGTEDWSASFDQDTSDLEGLFEMYESVSRQIADAMEAHLDGGSEARHERAAPATQNPKVYHLFKRAWFNFRANGKTQEALALIDQALAIEPYSVDAISSKASLIYLAAEFGHIPSKEGYEKAKSVALQTIELDATRPWPYLVLGGVSDRLDLDFPTALEHFKRAEALGGNITAWAQDTYMNAGLYEEGLRLTEADTLLNPGNPNALGLQARFLYRLGRLDEARELLDLSIQLGPRHERVISNALSHYIRGYKDKKRALEIISSIEDRELLPIWAEGELALLFGNREPLEEAVRSWEQNRQHSYVRASVIYLAHYFLGNYEDHMRWLVIREKEHDLLGWIRDELWMFEDYWDRHREWALSDPAKTRERLELIDAHRARIDRITERMVL